MDKVYQHQLVEEKIYALWEEKGYFKPEIHPEGKPYCIILPPPNANGDLHFGHAMFVLEDILIRYHRMKGDAALWLPGTDHAGTETQFVYEKKLQVEGKSRFDYSREELYQQIWDFVATSQGGIQSQLKRLGFSLDWSRRKFTLDPDIIKIVNQTFMQMHKDGLVYRDYRLVNYCTRDGTSFSDLEVLHEERISQFYYIKYGEFTIGTVRPETKFRDTALAVNPNDPRYKDKIGKTYEIMGLLGPISMKIIPDEGVNPEFGTGIMKVTPAHDPHDFELGKKHNLPVTPIIGFDGKMDFSWFLEKKDVASKYRVRAEKYHGKYVKEVRKLMVEDMKEDGLIIKIDENYTNRVGLCYKCKTVLEPLPLEQWYVKVTPLAKEALTALEKKQTSIYPDSFTKNIVAWYKNLKDWNISRQNVWGIQIPVWYEVTDEEKFTVTFLNKKKELEQGSLKEIRAKGYAYEEILSGLQKVIAQIDVPVVFADDKQAGKKYLPETDTFDTWFSSAQWPYVTLMTSKSGDFEKFYPTSVMETGRDILYFWVSRMLMMGLYKNKQVPFTDVVLHGLVNDPLGKKMSKSKGNVVNPLEVADQYGADSVRMALVYGTALGNDQAMSYPKLEAMRKFSNKLWNMARFIEMKRVQGEQIKVQSLVELKKIEMHKNDTAMVEKTEQLVKEVTKLLDMYDFNAASQVLYDFVWHEFADVYIEDVKNRMDATSSAIVESLYMIMLQLLHPFMPFITEEIYQKIPGHTESIMISSWPRTK
ncbi:valine--tRNA ligase [soil metagenome]